MKHGGCCDCAVCKVGKWLGLIDECNDECCKPKAKKATKKTVKKKREINKYF